MHADVPVARALYAPAAHVVHTADVLAEPTFPKKPSVHTVQPLVPVASALYVPTLHAVQAEVPLTRALNEPATHEVQATVPVISALYAPAKHAVHTAEVADAAASP